MDPLQERVWQELRRLSADRRAAAEAIPVSDTDRASREVLWSRAEQAVEEEGDREFEQKMQTMEHDMATRLEHEEAALRREVQDRCQREVAELKRHFQSVRFISSGSHHCGVTSSPT